MFPIPPIELPPFLGGNSRHRQRSSTSTKSPSVELKGPSSHDSSSLSSPTYASDSELVTPADAVPASGQARFTLSGTINEDANLDDRLDMIPDMHNINSKSNRQHEPAILPTTGSEEALELTRSPSLSPDVKHSVFGSGFYTLPNITIGLSPPLTTQKSPTAEAESVDHARKVGSPTSSAVFHTPILPEDTVSSPTGSPILSRVPRSRPESPASSVVSFATAAVTSPILDENNGAALGHEDDLTTTRESNDSSVFIISPDAAAWLMENDVLGSGARVVNFSSTRVLQSLFFVPWVVASGFALALYPRILPLLVFHQSTPGATISDSIVFKMLPRLPAPRSCMRRLESYSQLVHGQASAFVAVLLVLAVWGGTLGRALVVCAMARMAAVWLPFGPNPQAANNEDMRCVWAIVFGEEEDFVRLMLEPYLQAEVDRDFE